MPTHQGRSAALFKANESPEPNDPGQVIHADIFSSTSMSFTTLDLCWIVFVEWQPSTVNRQPTTDNRQPSTVNRQPIRLCDADPNRM